MRDLLKFMNVFVDGYGFAGVASSVVVPKIEVATREFSAAGMAGPIAVRMGRLESALTCDMNFEGFDPRLYEALDVTEGSLIPFTCKGSTEDGDGTPHAHNVAMRGFIKMLDEGEWKDGDSVPLKLQLSLRYYRRERDGIELFEIDQENMLFRVKGRDLLAQHRANLAI
ncbi:MAG: phage major tail tube protein [Pseudomonadota bacterium]